jgi:signal transduction histidine kinase
VQVTVVAEANAALIRVEDDGPGVPEAELDRLGRRGLRLDEQAPGHGLGLAIVGDIVEAYGGSLSFAPSSAGGLCVEVRLPT